MTVFESWKWIIAVAEWLERWTCNSEAPSSRPAMTAYWTCSL